jgi:hypothetical protein
MNTRSGFLVGILTGLILASAILVGLIIFWRTVPVPVVVASAPGSSPSPQTDIKVQVDGLSQRIDRVENDQAFALRDAAWKMDQKLFYLGGWAFLIAALAAFFGYRTYKDLDGAIREKANGIIQKELYQLDPTNIPIHLQSGQGMEPIHRRLQLSGLKNISFYDRLDKHCLNGIIIFAVADEQARQRFREFIETYSPDPFKAAYILYGPQGSVDRETLESYENLVTANFPATVASMVLVVGRGLKPDK